MNLEIQNKQTNTLLARTDVTFKASFDAGVPARKEVKSALSTALSIEPERIVIVRLSTTSGMRTVQGLAHVYDKPEAALKDAKHLLLRDGLVQKEDKKAAAKASAKK